MTATLTALLVAPPGSGRRGAATTLGSLGLQVQQAAEPYEGMARFVEQPADLVVVSLAAFRARDLAFLRTVRRRAPSTRILLLVPEGRRSLAVRALAVGAHVWLPEPWHAEELVAFVHCLVQPDERGDDVSAEGARAIRALSRELSHAVNNPLQVLTMVAENQKPTASALRGALEHVTRIRDAVRIVEGFGRLGSPALREAHLGTLVRESLEEAVDQGRIALASPLPRDGQSLPLDPLQIRLGIDALVAFLVGVGNEAPLLLKAAVHRPRPRQRRRSRGGTVREASATRWVEAAFKAKGLVLTPSEIAAYRGQVLCSNEDRRDPHPGLAPAALVASNHGGALVTRSTKTGTVFGLRFALP